MTKEELKNALPEMVLFAKTEEERTHFKTLQAIESSEELDEIVKKHALINEVKDENSTNSKIYKTR